MKSGRDKEIAGSRTKRSPPATPKARAEPAAKGAAPGKATAGEAPSGRTAAAVKAQARKRNKSTSAVDPVERRRLIEEVAWLRAERRRFRDGSPEEDWLAAEEEVDRLLARR